MGKNIQIIGSGFSSLSAACYLAHAGHQVSIYEKNSTVGGRARQIKKDGFTFDIGPSWYWMPDIFDRFFSDFGKKTSDYYQIDKLDPAYKIFFDDDIITIGDCMDKICNEFDTRYPEKIDIVNFFRTYDEFAWRIDLDVNQYTNMKENGIIYPICYNSTRSMLDRGTHRMLFLSTLGSSVPIFVQYPKTPNPLLEFKLGDYFGEGDTTMIVDMQTKKLKFYIDNKLIETY